jgi:hypothetical protein
MIDDDDDDVSNGPISLGVNDDYARFHDARPLVSRRNLCPWTRVGIHLLGLHHVVQILLTHRHMR